jgi:hypothetical protein
VTRKAAYRSYRFYCLHRLDRSYCFHRLHGFYGLNRFDYSKIVGVSRKDGYCSGIVSDVAVPPPTDVLAVPVVDTIALNEG